MERPKLKLTFKEPRAGHWEGGKRYGGEFIPELTVRMDVQNPNDCHPGTGYTIKWGSFELNFWFNSGSGRSWKEAAGIAKRRLAHLCKVPAKIEVIY